MEKNDLTDNADVEDKHIPRGIIYPPATEEPIAEILQNFAVINQSLFELHEKMDRIIKRFC